jgi:predicted membrane-bound spermidine synthase
MGVSRGAAASVLFLVLLVPTLLMGATLPVMTEAARAKPDLRALNFSALYLYNTLGGAAGAFLAGFVLLGSFGLKHSIYLAALANLLAAIAAALTIWSARSAAPDARTRS